MTATCSALSSLCNMFHNNRHNNTQLYSIYTLKTPIIVIHDSYLLCLELPLPHALAQVLELLVHLYISIVGNVLCTIYIYIYIYIYIMYNVQYTYFVQFIINIKCINIIQFIIYVHYTFYVP
jgi:hypothetical protein